MSAATDSFTEIVHARLLEEGVDVWRPGRSNGVYELAPEPAPEDEVWEFKPGELVSVKNRPLDDGRTEIATRIAVSCAPKRGEPAGRH